MAVLRWKKRLELAQKTEKFLAQGLALVLGFEQAGLEEVKHLEMLWGKD